MKKYLKNGLLVVGGVLALVGVINVILDVVYGSNDYFEDEEDEDEYDVDNLNIDINDDSDKDIDEEE